MICTKVRCYFFYYLPLPVDFIYHYNFGEVPVGSGPLPTVIVPHIQPDRASYTIRQAHQEQTRLTSSKIILMNSEIGSPDVFRLSHYLYYLLVFI